MAKLNLLKFFILNLTFAILLGLNSYAFDANQYPYYKKIILQDSINEPAIIKLDNQVLNYMKPDGSDLRITKNGNEIPLKILITHVEEAAHKGKIAAVSSARPDFRGASFDGNNLIDGDYSNNDNAYFQIDSLQDPNFAWFVIDLGSPALTDKIKIWNLNNYYTWTEVQVEGSNDNQNWKIIKSKTKYEIADVRAVAYPPVEYRYFRFSFWHIQSLVINEIEIYGAYNGQIVFNAKSGNDYRLFYGNLTSPHYN